VVAELGGLAQRRPSVRGGPWKSCPAVVLTKGGLATNHIRDMMGNPGMDISWDEWDLGMSENQ
jgi:hypothetical protein